MFLGSFSILIVNMFVISDVQENPLKRVGEFPVLQSIWKRFFGQHQGQYFT